MTSLATRLAAVRRASNHGRALRPFFALILNVALIAYGANWLYELRQIPLSLRGDFGADLTTVLATMIAVRLTVGFLVKRRLFPFASYLTYYR